MENESINYETKVKIPEKITKIRNSFEAAVTTLQMSDRELGRTEETDGTQRERDISLTRALYQATNEIPQGDLPDKITLHKSDPIEVNSDKNLYGAGVTMFRPRNEAYFFPATFDFYKVTGDFDSKYFPENDDFLGVEEIKKQGGSRQLMRNENTTYYGNALAVSVKPTETPGSDFDNSEESHLYLSENDIDTIVDSYSRHVTSEAGRVTVNNLRKEIESINSQKDQTFVKHASLFRQRLSNLIDVTEDYTRLPKKVIAEINYTTKEAYVLLPREKRLVVAPFTNKERAFRRDKDIIDLSSVRETTDHEFVDHVGSAYGELLEQSLPLKYANYIFGRRANYKPIT
jgi:hypothetical protein